MYVCACECEWRREGGKWERSGRGEGGRGDALDTVRDQPLWEESKCGSVREEQGMSDVR